MTNFESSLVDTNSLKLLTPEKIEKIVESYPELRPDFEDIVNVSQEMNALIKEFNDNLQSIEISEWDKKQKEVHDHLIISVLTFINDLEKYNKIEAENLKQLYSDDIEKRALFTQLALKFFNNN